MVFTERPGRDSSSVLNTAAWSDINRSTAGSSSTSVSDLRVIDAGFAQIFDCKIKDFSQTFSKILISFSRPKFSIGNSMVLKDI